MEKNNTIRVLSDVKTTGNQDGSLSVENAYKDINIPDGWATVVKRDGLGYRLDLTLDTGRLVLTAKMVYPDQASWLIVELGRIAARLKKEDK